MKKKTNRLNKNNITDKKYSSQSYKIQSFTFFIPAPPPRTTSYREKQFDKLFTQFINRGFRILHFNTQAVSSGEKHSGMWIICILEALTPEAEKASFDDLSQSVQDSLHNIQTNVQIEGLYYIESDDKATTSTLKMKNKAKHEKI